MLKGIDVSHHNRVMSLKGYDFVIIKATEGATYVDPEMENWVQQINQDGTYLRGFYHYARPEINTAKAEAKNFIKRVQKYADGRTIFALDWEGTALKYPLQWAIDWMNMVEATTGVKPLFYCQSSFTPYIKRIYENGNGLWVAHYTRANKPRIGAFPFWAIWQYDSKGFDKNYFNGNRVQFMRYSQVE